MAIRKDFCTTIEEAVSRTKPYRPYKLVYLEKFNMKSEALRREKQLKSYKGGGALKKLIARWGAGVDNRNGL